MKQSKQIGECYRFVYPDYGTPDTYPDYTAHSGQNVIVQRCLTNKECDPECQPMFEIKADDGWVGTAHEIELKNQINYQRGGGA